MAFGSRHTHRRSLTAIALFAALFAALGGIGAAARAQQRGDATADATSAGGVQLPPIQIEGRQAAPPLGHVEINGLSEAPLSETPLSASVISAAHLAERGAQSLSAAVRDQPGVADNYNTFGYVEALQVRGFALDEVLNYRRDGLVISSHAPVALENKEAIEILAGAAGILAGTSAPAGIVNYVLKRPTDVPLRSAGIGLSERGSTNLHADIGGRAGTDDRFGYRINVAAEQRRPEIDHAWSQRGFASGFFDWRAGPSTRVEVEAEQHDVREISVPAFGLLDTHGAGHGTTLPPPLDPHLNLNAQPWTLPFESRETVGSLRLTQGLAGGWRLAFKVGMQRVRTNDRIAFPDGCSAQTPVVYPGLCASDGVDIYDFRSNGERRLANDADLNLHGRIAAGAFEHELTAGVRAAHTSERYPAFQTYNFAGTIDALAPADLAPVPDPQTPNTDTARRIAEAYLFDTLRFAQRWSAWLGARATRIAQSSMLTAPDGIGGTAAAPTADPYESVASKQKFITPFGALGVRPWEGGFAYLSAGTAVETAAVPNRPLDFANSGAVLPASRSRQVELGFKQAGDAGTGWTAALFQIMRPMTGSLPAGCAPGTASCVDVAGARLARHRGLDLSDTWRIGPTWLYEARAELLNARIQRADDNPALAGRRSTNAAPLTASLRAVWEPAPFPGLAWSNLLVHSGRKPVLADDSVELPSSWQWDSGVRYRSSLGAARAIWSAGIDNVTNRRYWREAPTTSWNGTYLFPAAARSLRVGLTVLW